MIRFGKKEAILAMTASMPLMFCQETFAQTEPVQPAAADGEFAGLEQVVVTARRREESAQSTPVALAVLSAEQLDRQGIEDLRDLTAAVPGVNFTVSGGSNNTVFNIRGMSRGVIGNQQPSVASYVNEVSSLGDCPTPALQALPCLVRSVRTGRHRTILNIEQSLTFSDKSTEQPEQRALNLQTPTFQTSGSARVRTMRKAGDDRLCSP